MKKRVAELRPKARSAERRSDQSLDLRHSDRRCEAPQGGAIKMLELRHSDRRCEAPQGGAITGNNTREAPGAFAQRRLTRATRARASGTPSASDAAPYTRA